MKIKNILLIIICILMLIPNVIQATNLNMIEEQYKQEANRIISKLEEQKNDTQMTNNFIISLLVTIIISMIFENIVKIFKYDIKEKNKNEDDSSEVRKKLWITYGIHFLVLLIMYLIYKYALKMTGLYIAVLIIISICNVEIGPLLQIRIGRNKKEKEN